MGNRGPLPTPTAQKELAGNPGRRPLNEDEPVPVRGAPEMPPQLTGLAAETWERVCKHLSELDLLATSDEAVIAAYCVAWELYWENYVAMKQFGTVLVSTKTHKDGDKTHTTKTPYTGPHAGLHSMFFKELMTCCAALGLGPAWRAGVTKIPGVDTQDGKSRFFKVVG